MPRSILERLQDFERQRPPGRGVPKVVAERLAQYFPKVMIGWDGARKLWCLAERSRRGVEFLCYIERGGKYAPLTLRNTVDWLRAGQIARVARTKYELERFRQGIEAVRQAARVARQKAALDQMRTGDKELYNLAVGRKVVAIHGRRSHRKSRR